MIEVIKHPLFWFISFAWFVGLVLNVTDATDTRKWNWKQMVFMTVIAGPVAWGVAALVGILAGLMYFWELLGDKPKKP